MTDKVEYSYISNLSMGRMLLRGEDVARILNCSKAFAFQLIRQGRLPAVHIGRAVRVRQEDLDAFIAKNVE